MHNAPILASRITLGVLICALGACRPGIELGAIGDYCSHGSECASGLCPDHWCTGPCDDDADCAGDRTGIVCGIAPDGSRQCVPDCSGDEVVIDGRILFDGYVCVAGVSTACEQVTDPTFCRECGCDAPSTRCEPGVGCMPPSEIDGPCIEDDDCRTGNCSRYSGVCRVVFGGPCIGGDCDLCLIDDERGTSFCSRDCETTHNPCGAASVCAGPVARNGICMPGCADCPTSCTSDGHDRYCGARYRPVHAPRPLGVECTTDTQCESGDCFDAPVTITIATGTCTSTCSTDADCAPSARCVDVPCAAGQSDDCGRRCLRSCAGPEMCPMYVACGPLPASGGGTVDVCDPRRGDGEYCESAATCRSLRCEENHCLPAGGWPPGYACSSPSQCASAMCLGGRCTGAALLGDACASPADCAVGECCNTGPAAGTCQSTC